MIRPDGYSSVKSDYADEAIKSGTATPMIIVMPDANTGKRGYVNDVKGEWRYEDFFFQEFMPFIEISII